MVANSLMLYGKVEQHRCSFFNKQGTEAKEVTNSFCAHNKDLVLICLQSHWPHAVQSLTGLSHSPACPAEP